MQKITTKFGDVYIEEFGDHNREKGRIKLFDSECRYLNYLSEDMMKIISDEENMSLMEHYEKVIKEIGQCEKIEDFLDYSGCQWIIAVNNIDVFREMSGIDDKNLLDNEWVNKIGEWWIKIAE